MRRFILFEKTKLVRPNWYRRESKEAKSKVLNEPKRVQKVYSWFGNTACFSFSSWYLQQWSSFSRPLNPSMSWLHSLSSFLNLVLFHRHYPCNLLKHLTTQSTSSKISFGFHPSLTTPIKWGICSQLSRIFMLLIMSSFFKMLNYNFKLHLNMKPKHSTLYLSVETNWTILSGLNYFYYNLFCLWCVLSITNIFPVFFHMINKLVCIMFLLYLVECMHLTAVFENIIQLVTFVYVKTYI